MGASAATEQGPQWAEIAYEAIAPVYDDFTSHHDYELWLGSLLPQLRRHGLSGRRLLDVGCGTGKSFLPMLERGWEVTACDISASMVELARDKAGDEARLSVADMRELPVFGEFDLVWSLDDAVNYLLSVEELERALTGMRRNLAPGGLLMFDVNTLRSYRTFFAETEVREARGRQAALAGKGVRGHAARLDLRSELRGDRPRRRAGDRARDAPPAALPRGGGARRAEPGGPGVPRRLRPRVRRGARAAGRGSAPLEGGLHRGSAKTSAGGGEQ